MCLWLISRPHLALLYLQIHDSTATADDTFTKVTVAGISCKPPSADDQRPSAPRPTPPQKAAAEDDGTPHPLEISWQLQQQ